MSSTPSSSWASLSFGLSLIVCCSVLMRSSGFSVGDAEGTGLEAAGLPLASALGACEKAAMLHASRHRMMKIRRNATPMVSTLGVGAAFLDQLGQFRNDLEQIADHPEVGKFEDRRVGVFVDRDDGARRPHADLVLDRARDPHRD